jgi:hypothetical protein
MTAVDAKAPPLAAPSPVAAARLGPAGAATSARPTSKGVAAPTRTVVPPAPPEHKITPELSPEHAAKAAIKAVHAVRAELHALVEAKAPPERIESKRQEFVTLKNSAIAFATENRELWRSKARAAVDLVLDTRLNLEHAQNPTIEAKTAAATAVQNAEAAVEKFAEADSLLQQAKGTPQENLITARDNLRIAQGRYSAAEAKLKEANNQLKEANSQQHSHKKNARAADAAQKEFDGAASQLEQAKRDVPIAEQAVTDPANRNGR